MKNSISRRAFVQTSLSAAAGLAAFPYIHCGKIGVRRPVKRMMGRIGFEATTLGLGGQASLQWTPPEEDPQKILLKAFELGVNYFDTSNLYGPSQTHYGKAFRTMDLIPGRAGYDEKLRRSIFLTSKTHLRWAKGSRPVEGVTNWSNNPEARHALEDVRRSLSQIFGDGQGAYPRGAYLDMVLIHDLTTQKEVEALYTGLADPDPKAEQIGALAALRDVRDGTNRTGLNPKEEKMIRHVGFSGHFSPPAMTEMIQRDEENLLEGLLVAINANDRLYFNMQHNVIPIARAKDMGLIAMKVFADGALYSKSADWSWKPEHVVRTVGSADLPSRPLVEYSLTVPGIHTAIIGIGHVDENPEQCQLTQNLSAAQIAPHGLSEDERRAREIPAHRVKGGKTNYFQMEKQELTPPRDPALIQTSQEGAPVIRLTWQTAFAGDEPVRAYEVFRDGAVIGSVDHEPQTTKKPFHFDDTSPASGSHEYTIVSVDAAGKRSGPVRLTSMNAG